MAAKGTAGGAAPKPLHPAEQMPLKLVRSDQRQLFNQHTPASASPYTTTTSPKRDDASNPPVEQVHAPCSATNRANATARGAATAAPGVHTRREAGQTRRWNVRL
jgi:hypothetical protein